VVISFGVIMYDIGSECPAKRSLAEKDHAIALTHYAIVYARAWAADSINTRVRLAAENDRFHEVCALLREELRIKDTRIAQIAPQCRPHYGPHERMAILELRAARGWSSKRPTPSSSRRPRLQRG